MATKIGIGVSIKLDSAAAGIEAVRNALYQLARPQADIFIVFISPIFDQGTTIKAIRSIINYAPLVGCSSAAIITNLGVYRNAVSVCAISSDSASFSPGIGHGINKDSRMAGNQAAKSSSNLKGAAKQLYIIFSDPFSGNAADILRGVQEVRGTSFPIIGGSAIDDLKFQRSYQYLNNKIYGDSVVGLLVGGDIKIGTGNAHGWGPIGRPHKITSSRLNVIKEIDGLPASRLYEGYLGKTLEELKMEGIAKLGCSYPLGIRLGEGEEYLIRIPLKIDSGGSLILNAEIPEGKNINLMIGDKKSALEAVGQACSHALIGIKKLNIRFALVLSDIGRFLLLRKDPAQEIEVIKEVLGKDIPFFGCYTCGIYAPANLQGYGGQSHFHSQSIAITVFSEQSG